MIDTLSALSVYRQLEGLESTVKAAKGGVLSEWMIAFTNQGSFNHMLNQITSQCSDAPEYLASLSHIGPENIPAGGDRSVYPRFSTKVTMLRQAVGALLEMNTSSEQKKQIGFQRS
jgi:hypothetical protein